MDKWRGKVALVTGASVGIGAEICRALVKEGMTVIGAARGVEQVQTISEELKNLNCSGQLIPYKCDLTKDEEVLGMFKYIKENHRGVNVCINNAGLSHYTSILDGTPNQWRNMLDVNVVALCLCAKETIASLKERNIDDGHVINISSVLGHIVFEVGFSHFYGATKFAVQAITEGLRQELRADKSHIRVTSIGPGVVDTEFADRMTGVKGTQKLLNKGIGKVLDPGDIAASIIYVLSAPPHVDVNDLILRPTDEMM